MNNMTNIISSHNKKVANSYNGKACNCRNESNCPLGKKCLTDKFFYKAEVETSDGINELSTKTYFGISDAEFKSRYNNHTMSFRNRTHENLRLINSQTHYNLTFYLTFHVFCIYKKLFEKINITI